MTLYQFLAHYIILAKAAKIIQREQKKGDCVLLNGRELLEEKTHF